MQTQNNSSKLPVHSWFYHFKTKTLFIGYSDFKYAQSIELSLVQCHILADWLLPHMAKSILKQWGIKESECTISYDLRFKEDKDLQVSLHLW